MHDEIVKPQWMRLLDVFVLGPFLIYSGSTKKMHPVIKVGLIAAGTGTIIYNGANYLKIRKFKNGSQSHTGI